MVMPRRNDQNDAFGQKDLQPLEKYDERNANHEKCSLNPYQLREAVGKFLRNLAPSKIMPKIG